jgi:hypothetical protein
MALESRGPIAIDPGATLKKKKKIFMNKGPIAKCQNLWSKMKMPISAEETTSFQGGLFILFLLGIEELTCKREKRNEK